MKLFARLYMVAFSVLMLAACDEDGTDVVAVPKAASALEASATTLALTQEAADDNALTLTRTDADFGYKAAIQYTAEFTKKNGSAESVQSIAMTTSEVSLTVEELNDLALALGMETEVAGEVEVKVKAQVSSLVEGLYSNIVTLTITPYESGAPYATIYLVGAAAESGDAGSATPIFRDTDNGFVYTFTGNFNAGWLKLLAFKGAWIPSWGMADGTKAAFRASDTDADPASFTIGDPGYYTFSLNTLTLDYTITPFDESAAVDYSGINITGDFSGWALIPMANTVTNPHVWTVEYTFTEATSMKFASDGWSAQWGPTEKHDRLYGKGEPAGDNDKVAIAPGTYTIVFNDLSKHYVLIEQ